MSPPTNPERWFRDLAWALNLFPKEQTSFAPLEKFHMKSTLKNRGGCDEGQFRDSR